VSALKAVDKLTLVDTVKVVASLKLERQFSARQHLSVRSI